MSLDRITGSALTVNYTVSGTAINGVDYLNLPGSVTISAGQTTGTITVTPIDDGLVESSETVIVTLAANAAYQVASPNSATVTITDNDSPHVSSISPNPVDLAAAPANFTITGGGFANFGFGLPAVNFMRGGVYLTAMRASAGTSTSLTVPFSTGLSAGPLTVEVYNQTGASSWSLVGSTQLGVLDSRLVASVAAVSATASETGPTAGTFTVSLDNITGSALTVNYAVSGTAINGVDYLNLPGTLVIGAGQSTGTITLMPIDDALVESGETVIVTLVANAAYRVGSSNSATVTITDNDSPHVGLIAPNPVDLAAPPASFTISGNGFTNAGFGLPAVNFIRGGVYLTAMRASAGTSTSLTVPFPTGLSVGPVTVEVYNQTGSNNWSLVGSTSLTVTDSRLPPPAQVRVFNDLLICNPGCVAFNGRLSASEGYTWFATSGNYSPYQTVFSATLSNFQVEAIGFGITASIFGSFNISPGRKYVVVATVDAADNLVLIQVDEGSLPVSTPGESLTSQSLMGRLTNSSPTVQFASAQSSQTSPP